MQTTTELVARLSADRPENARNLGGTKETVERQVLMAFSGTDREREVRKEWRDKRSAGFSQVVDARWYMGRSASASMVYCSVWIHGRDGEYRSGHGSAGGYGYHKSSAALADALRSAGVSLVRVDEDGTESYGDIGGAGETAVRDALHAVAKACGYGRCPQVIV